MSKNDKLNQKLFDKDNRLKEDVKESLVKIANTFIEDLQENNIPVNIVDIWLVGSNAAYNYRDDSDIDLHIIADFDETDNNGLLSLVYNYAKADFNKDHDITVKGMPVEVYIESSNTTSVTNGIYSLLNDEWVKFPTPVEVDRVETEESEAIFDEMKNAIADCVESGDIDKIQEIIDGIYLTRQASLATEGENGAGNLAFKKIRSSGLLDKLKEKKRELVDRDLTLEKLEKSKKKDNTIQAVFPGNPETDMNIFNNSMMGSAVAEELEDDGYTRLWSNNSCSGIEVDKDGRKVRFIYNTINSSDGESTEEKCVGNYFYEMPYSVLLEIVDDALTNDERREMYKADFEDDNLTPEQWIENNLPELLKKHGQEIYDNCEYDAKLEARDRAEREIIYIDNF